MQQGGYKDGLQPETLADGNWLVKQNQPVSKMDPKLWHKLEEEMRQPVQSFRQGIQKKADQVYKDRQTFSQEVRLLITRN